MITGQQPSVLFFLLPRVSGSNRGQYIEQQKKAIESDISAHEFTWSRVPRTASSHSDAG